MFAKKRIRGEPFKCAGGLPVTSYAHAPTIFAVSCKQKLKCLVDTGCTKYIVAAKTAKRLNVAMSACNERISLMNISLLVLVFVRLKLILVMLPLRPIV